MKVLIIGGGAREHAMVEAVRRSGADVYAVMKNANPGIARAAAGVELAAETDADTVVAAARKWGVDLAVVGPEAPLAAGVSDALEAAGVPCASPSKAAARVETDKAFMRDLLERHDVPGRLKFRVFDSLEGVEAFVDQLGEVAVKPVGLTGGKGVKVTGDHLQGTADAVEYAREIFENDIGGARVVVEEKAVGEEFTVMAFSDGTVTVPMPAVQDHKRAYEGDEGPNTGGMGSYSDAGGLLPFITRADYEEAALIVQKIVDALAADGCPFKGTIYGQFMLTADGCKVIEVNARFGDPEAMNVLTLLKSDYVAILRAMAEGALGSAQVDFAPEATVCKYVVPEGYGTKPAAGEPLTVDEAAVGDAGAVLYYASVNAEGEGEAGGVVRASTTTSRSLGVVATAATIAEAEAAVEAALAHVEGERLFVRHDIGKADLVERRVAHMRSIRGH